MPLRRRFPQLVLAAFAAAAPATAAAQETAPGLEPVGLAGVARATMRLEARVAADPELEAYTEAAELAGTPAGLDAFDFATLDDSTAVTVLDLLVATLERVDEPTCADMVGGAPGPDGDFNATLAQLDSATVERWMELTYRGMLAQARGNRAAAPVDPARTQLVMMNAFAAMPPEELERVVRISSGGDDVTAADHCWFGRTLFRRLLELPPESQLTLVRSFFTSAAGSSQE